MAELEAGSEWSSYSFTQLTCRFARRISQMPPEQSTASVEKLVGKPRVGAARARVFMLGAGLPEI
jgi:hypothetical protein